MTDRDYPEETTPRKAAKKAKKTKRKQSPETVAKRMQTMKAKRAAKAAGLLPPDLKGAIAALRAAKRAIREQFCAGKLTDFGDVELNVLVALRLLEGA